MVLGLIVTGFSKIVAVRARIASIGYRFSKIARPRRARIASIGYRFL